MIRNIYICDRCGQESNIKMNQFSFTFDIGEYGKDLRTINTGHLCITCAHDLSEHFFNQMVAWCKK